jgi:hypothetical protein
MPTTVGQHAVAAFTSPINGTSPIDATTVRTNDNTLRTSYVNHDADPGIHVQSSALASRPAAGTAGRKWMTVDGSVVRMWYDDGTNWQEQGSPNNVVGPASATDNAITRFDGTTGKLVQNSTVTIADNGAISSNVSNLTSAGLKVEGTNTAGGLVLYGGQFIFRSERTGGTNPALGTAISAESFFNSNVNTTNHTGVYVRVTNSNVGSGVISQMYGINLTELSGNANSKYGIRIAPVTGTIANNAIGLLIGDITTTGGNNYAILTGLGLVEFGDVVNTTEHYQVDGVQVVSNQGAAVADATGAGDVVAQLNELLSRLRTHGLIAT